MSKAKRRAATRRDGLHPLISAGIRRAEKARKAGVIARPMRDLFALLMSGDVMEIDGRAVMRMPEIDQTVTERAEWCEIAPAVRGWIDCWSRLAPDIGLYRMGVLADRLERDQEITPRLVEQASAEFEETIARLHDMPDGAITRAITTTQIGWELERLGRGSVRRENAED